MKLHDQHLHCWHSADSQADPRDNCLRAIERGLSGLTFTDHFDNHPTEWAVCKWDYPASADTIAALRDEFGDRLRIGFGIEVCYQPEMLPVTLDYLSKHAFDVVLLSAHWWDRKALHERDHWDGLDWRHETRRYLENVLAAARLCLDFKGKGEKPFDILGHIDLIKRYTQRYFQNYDIRAHADVVDEILRTAIAADMIPEINTSTLRQNLPEPMPADWEIRRYAELGGTAMSIGSDAHRSEDISADFDQATDLLRDAGIHHEAVFFNRKLETIAL
jgi:histidinol-phosphatase (PHP family)